MVEEVPHFYTTFWSRRYEHYREEFQWIHHTFYQTIPSSPIEGDLKRFLKKHFGSSAVGVLVDGELWTDESVFWQGRLEDRGKYEVVHSKPGFFDTYQKELDKETGVPYSSDVPHAAKVPSNAPRKIKSIYGPTRRPNELRFPWQYGTWWGEGDWRNGLSWIQLAPEHQYFAPAHGSRPQQYEPPPKYATAVNESHRRCGYHSHSRCCHCCCSCHRT